MMASASMSGASSVRLDLGDAALCAEYLDEHGDAHPHAVTLLPPVHRARILVDGRVDLGAARQRMHDDGVALELCELLCAEAELRKVDAARFAGRIPFRLHARDV